MLRNCMFNVMTDLTFTKPMFTTSGTLPQSDHMVASRRISLQLTPMAPMLGLGNEQDKEEEVRSEQEDTSHMTGKCLERSDSRGGI
jgi:hypothetical protein